MCGGDVESSIAECRLPSEGLPCLLDTEELGLVVWLLADCLLLGLSPTSAMERMYCLLTERVLGARDFFLRTWSVDTA